MTKFFLLTALIAMMASSAFSQTDRCGTTEAMQLLFQENPGYQDQLRQIDEYAHEFAKNNPGGTRTVVTIPVVVHVVYNVASENITDAQVQTQIDVLNEDFRRLNPDVNETPAAWTSVAADVEINFCLAARDPSGNATNGITHTSTTKTSFSTNNNVKFNSQGGENAWDRNKYLNLWCCDLSSSTIGYAQFPGGPANTDGVVCDYFYFGRFGSAHAPYNLGRTATHEIGHWLNLYHIWGDDFTGCNGSDQVADTPNQADETYQCPLPTIRISCSNGPNGDMYSNYMDYTDDGCMNLFTAGQKTRMQALFGVGGSRVSLLTSDGCVPPGGVTCNVPSGLNTTAITSTSATLNWSAASGAITYNIQYKPVSSGTWISTTSGTTSKAISGLTTSTLYEFQVQSDCGGGTTSNFSSSSNFTTSTPTCTDVYEANNSKANAKPIPVNTNITAKIGKTTDKDFFSFANTASEPNINVVLSNLPADYDIFLYNPSGAKISSSENAGQDDEIMIWNTSIVGTYKVQVFGAGGVFNNSVCYTLNAQISNSPFKTNGMVNGTKVTGALTNIYPNPSNGNMTVEYSSASISNIQLVAYDLIGRIIFNQQSVATEGANAYNVSIKDLAPGVYVFEIKNGTETSHMKFTVSK